MMRQSIFAIEVCARLESQGALQPALAHLIKSHPAAATHQDKWLLYRGVADALLQNLHLIDKGCWDYFDEDEKAKSDYRMWLDGMLTREGARQEPSLPDDAAAYRADNSPRWLTFTMAFLVHQGTPCDRTIAQWCDIPESNLWRRDVFRHLFNAVPVLNFGAVVSDVIYLIPQDVRWGLTQEDLALPKFHYLRELV